MMKRLSVGLLPFLMFVLLASVAKAIASGSFVVSGQITKPDGSALESSSVNFTVEISDQGAGTCVLWSESFANTDMTASGGNFSLNLGSGTRNDTGATLNQVFSNQNTLSGSLCVGGYTPAAGDERKIKISFSESGGATQTLSSQLIKAVPTAATVGGYGSANLAKISGVGSANTFTPMAFDFLYNISAPGLSNATPCTDGQVLQYQNSAWHCAAVGAYGPVTFATTPQWSGTPTVANDLANKAYVDAQVVAGLPSFGTAGTYTKVTTDTKGRVSSGTTLAATDIPSLDAAKITSGIIPISLGGTGSSAALTGSKVIVSSASSMTEGMGWSTAKTSNTFVSRDSSGNIFGANGTFDGAALLSGGLLSMYGGTSGVVNIGAPSIVTSYNLILPNSAGTNGQVLTTNGAGVTSWMTAAGGADNLGNHTASTNLDMANFNVINAAGYFTAGAGQVITSSGFSFLKAFDVAGMAAPAVSAGGRGMLYFDSTTNHYMVSENGSAYTNILLNNAGSVSDANIASLVTPGKITIGATSATGMAVGTVSGTGKGLLIGPVNAVGAKGISVTSVTNGNGIAVAASGTGIGLNITSTSSNDAVDISNSVGTALYVSSGLTSVQTLLASQFQSNGFGSASAPMFVANADTTTGMFFPSAGYIGFSNSGTERMRIDINGNVGVGTSSPGAVLDVQKTNTAISASTLHSNSLTISPASPPSTGNNMAVKGVADYNSSFSVSAPGAYDNVMGVFGAAKESGIGTPNSMSGVYGTVINTTSASTIPNAAAISGYIATPTAGGFSSASAVKGAVAQGAGTFSIAIGGDFSVTANTPSSVTNAIGVRIGSVQGLNKFSLYASDSAAPSYFAGNVGIGTATPGAKLQVTGSIVNTEYVLPSGNVADFVNGNTIVLQSVGGNSITLANMVAGGSYRVIVEDLASRPYTFSAPCGTQKFSPANAATTAGAVTIYNIYYRSTGVCYIDWTPGFQ